jgi:hypothetical protein
MRGKAREADPPSQDAIFNGGRPRDDGESQRSAAPGKAFVSTL